MYVAPACRYNPEAVIRVPSQQSPANRPPHPLVFAHRGGRALGPENTIPAFARGLAAGADGLELDVHLARDGVPVVHHDAELDRCTNASGPIRALTAAELSRVDAGWRFEDADGRSWRGRGAGVPTLADVLLRWPDVPAIVEIKASGNDAAAAVVDVIRRTGSAGRVCVGSFSLATIREVRRLAPSIATSASRPETQWALYRSWCGMKPGRVAYRAFQVPERSGRLTVVSPRFIRLAHAAGLAVQVWTVNDEADMRRLLDWGVDGLITDRPDLAVAVRDRWMAERATATAQFDVRNA
jgi:glycerophosphoryl diester phosphodiesterase